MILATTKRCCLIISFFQSTSPIVNIPIFELTVQLLYSHQPDDLVHFVTFVHQAREAQLTSDSTFSRQCKKVSKYQTLKILPYASLQPFLSLSLSLPLCVKGHFYQRALDVIIPPTNTASSNQVFAYCQLLLSR